MGHALTALIFAYHYVVVYMPPPPRGERQSLGQLAKEEEQLSLLRLIGFSVYVAVGGAIAFSFVRYKLIQGKSWENISVRNGLFLVKAAMLVGGKSGPLLYFCFLLQFYNFALVINHRRDSRPGATFPLQCFFAYFMMQQYFYRGNHRERFNSFNFGKVCPAGMTCNEFVHWVLILFELWAPYFLSMSLFPLFVKARVQHAYAHIKKQE